MTAGNPASTPTIWQRALSDLFLLAVASSIIMTIVYSALFHAEWIVMATMMCGVVLIFTASLTLIVYMFVFLSTLVWTIVSVIAARSHRMSTKARPIATSIGARLAGLLPTVLVMGFFMSADNLSNYVTAAIPFLLWFFGIVGLAGITGVCLKGGLDALSRLIAIACGVPAEGTARFGGVS